MGAGLQVHRHRRRPRRRLRRQPHQLRVLDELHARGVRERRRLPHRERLQRARHRAPGDRERIGSRDRRAPQPARVQRARQLAARPVPRRRRGRAGMSPARDDVPQPVRDMFDAYRSISERRLVECYHDALQAREQALQMFNLGYLGLEARGLVERLYWATCAKIRDLCRRLDSVPEELEGLESSAERHLLLQRVDLPVAAGQLGHRPALPDHADPPARRAPDAQRGARGHHLRLRRQDRPLREPARVEAHARAARARATASRTTSPSFLVGAYQETLGDLHNLFGDTHVVHIKLHDEGGWWIEETVKGDTAAEVLQLHAATTSSGSYPQFARDCERAVREGRLSLAGEPGAAALLRVRAERLHLPRAGLTPCTPAARVARTTGERHGTEGTCSRSSAPSSSPSSATRRSSRRCCSPSNRPERARSASSLAASLALVASSALGVAAGIDAVALRQHAVPVDRRRCRLHPDRRVDPLGRRCAASDAPRDGRAVDGRDADFNRASGVVIGASSQPYVRHAPPPRQSDVTTCWKKPSTRNPIASPDLARLVALAGRECRSRPTTQRRRRAWTSRAAIDARRRMGDPARIERLRSSGSRRCTRDDSVQCRAWSVAREQSDSRRCINDLGCRPASGRFRIRRQVKI